MNYPDFDYNFIPGADVRVGDRIEDRSGIYRFIFGLKDIYTAEGATMRAASIGNEYAIIALHLNQPYAVLREHRV